MLARQPKAGRLEISRPSASTARNASADHVTSTTSGSTLMAEVLMPLLLEKRTVCDDEPGERRELAASEPVGAPRRPG